MQQKWRDWIAMGSKKHAKSMQKTSKNHAFFTPWTSNWRSVSTWSTSMNGPKQWPKNHCFFQAWIMKKHNKKRAKIIQKRCHLISLLQKFHEKLCFFAKKRTNYDQKYEKCNWIKYSKSPKRDGDVCFNKFRTWWQKRTKK